ncbi:MAG: trypsin-like peptidase domain-containing protein [Cyanosarcina radialis HA8281-LM2]|jgi:serine protease Do|nr:trypsin-like peptidase domain-containing protein [Cyanosarcina radialis HA8281-LM2]
MSTKRLRLAAVGSLAAGAAIAINIINVSSDLGKIFQPTKALAQDVDEQVNIRVYQQASPAVVSVYSSNGVGSGTIITKDGYVLTNAHVIQNTTRPVTVVLSDGTRLEADIIAFGERGLDLAVVKIRDRDDLPTINMASAGSVQVGQKAFAIGNPFGQFEGTFTTGIVSRIDSRRGLIQTDAAINPGNSGGPLLNSQGELIGVNTAIFTSGQEGGNIGIGFAIGVDRIQPFLVAVREGRAPRTAQVRRPNPQRQQLRVQNLLLGRIVTARLGNGDNVLPVDNSFFDLYVFQGRAGQGIQIDMVSRQIDPFLILLSPNGRELAQNDNGGGGRNARIVGVLPRSGNYIVIANTSGAGQSGSYRIRAIRVR